MSVSKWAWTEECDNRICIGECDLCSYAEEDNEDEQIRYHRIVKSQIKDTDFFD